MKYFLVSVIFSVLTIVGSPDSNFSAVEPSTADKMSTSLSYSSSSSSVVLLLLWLCCMF